VVRPGAPAGPHGHHPAVARRGRLVVGERVRDDVRIVLGIVRLHRTRKLRQTVVGQGRADAQSGHSKLVTIGRASRHHREWPHLEPAQVVDGRLVEPWRLEGDDGHVGLSRRRRGEQVGDVDTPPQHHHARLALEQRERRGLPRSPRGQHQHDDHAGPQPRRTTVTAGESTLPRAAK
jgi:hypothetical protein